MTKDIKLLIDKYELTMNEVYIRNGEVNEYSYYDAFFRNIPFKSGYAITAGLDKIINFVKNFKFDEDDIAYLRSLNTFSEEHLEYLANFRFRGDIYAIPDGTPVFANEPLLTIKANKIEANLLETIILSYLNEHIKFATGAARIMEAADGLPVMEFGSRRADGPYAAIDASKTAFMVGAVGTSNLAAGKLYDIPVMGTMAHSYIQDADSEYEGFLDYAKVFLGDTIFLVDTYDTLKSGIPNAIRVYKEFLEPNGYDLKGIRIDSGDLLELSVKARALLDEAGMENTKILLSNGLDAKAIKALKDAKAPIDFLGVGDNIVAPKERVGVVYKLVGKEKNQEIIPKIKKSDDVFKTINPGYKKVYRLYAKNINLALGDIIASHDEIINGNYYHQLAKEHLNQNGDNKSNLNDFTFHVQELQVPIFKDGRLVYDEPTLAEKRVYCLEQISTLPEDIRRIENPGLYPVELTKQVKSVKKQLIEAIAKKDILSMRPAM